MGDLKMAYLVYRKKQLEPISIDLKVPQNQCIRGCSEIFLIYNEGRGTMSLEIGKGINVDCEDFIEGVKKIIRKVKKKESNYIKLNKSNIMSTNFSNNYNIKSITRGLLTINENFSDNLTFKVDAIVPPNKKAKIKPTETTTIIISKDIYVSKLRIIETLTLIKNIYNVILKVEEYSKKLDKESLFKKALELTFKLKKGVHLHMNDMIIPIYYDMKLFGTNIDIAYAKFEVNLLNYLRGMKWEQLYR
jgi:hypothetical protein